MTQQPLLNMKGHLKSKESGRLFPINKKVTTIGKDGCDVNVQAAVVEKEHALIELDNSTGTFCIRDLNTPHGTYVNDSRIQNSAAKIATGDIIRLGHSGPSFEVQIDSSSFFCPPIYSQQAWASSEPANEADPIGIGTQFPFLTSYLPTDEGQSYSADGVPLPYPSSVVHGSRILDPRAASAVMPHPPARSRTYAETGKPRPKSHTVINDTNGQNLSLSGTFQSTTFFSAEERIQELEQRLLKMGDELSRLASFEAECYRKDSVIVSLRNEIAELKSKDRNTTYSLSPRNISNATDILQSGNQFLKNLLREKEDSEKQSIQRFAHLQCQLSHKDRRISQLEDEVNQLKNTDDQDSLHDKYTEKIASLQSELSRKEQMIFRVQNELDKIKKQKTQSANLVNTLQRESSAKDSIINKVRSESERLKKEIKEKESHISALSTKKIKNLETQLREKMTIIQNLQDDLQQSRAHIASGQKNDRVLQQELHHTRSQFVDFERSERTLKIDLREWQNKFEKFQKRLIQAIYRLGVPVPNKQLDEDDIVQQVRLICEERVDLQQKTQELTEQLEKGAVLVKDFDKWKKKFTKAFERLDKKLLKRGRHCKVLEEEGNYFKEMEVPDELTWVKEAISNILVQEHRWQQDLEEAMEDMGFSREVQMDKPFNLIKELKEKMTEKEEELKAFKRKLSNISRTHEDELTTLRTKLIEEAQETASDNIAIIKREEEEKRQKMVEHFEKYKKEVIKEVVEKERRAFQNEYGDLAELKKRCNENQREADECRAKMIILEQKTEQLQASLDQLKHKEDLSQKQLEDQETRHRVQLEALQKEREEYNEKVQEDIKAFKEQARQHSLTIVALEEKILKVNKEKKNLEFENQRYKQFGPGYHEDPGRNLPPNRSNKPTSTDRIYKKDACVSTGDTSGSDIHLKEQIRKLEKLLEMLRKEMSGVEKETKQKDEVVKKLKKELNIATARLSDMAGELDDMQKQKIDDLQLKLKKKDDEIQEQRKQLLKLSSLIDKQKEELLKRENSVTKLQELLVKQKGEIDDRTKEIWHMREVHETERDGLDDKVAKLSEERIQMKDFKSAGARCIGEKHDDIIRKQKVALSDLRAAIKSQVAAPAATTQEAALSQIGALKKEVTDLRYQLATRDQDIYKSENELETEARASRELLYSASQEVNVEKVAHKETLALLDSSEQSYFKLLRSVCEALDVSNVPNIQTIAHVPLTEAPRLLKEREKGLKAILKGLQNLQERLERKEGLLDGYEKDLKNLRKTESLVGKKSAEAVSLATNVRNQKDEIAYLRESLNRVRDELDQQKRLNKSLEERKVFMMDYHEKEKRKPSHNCGLDEEKTYKEETKKKKQAEKLKRKNYEIESLKRELHFADRELNETAAKLHAMGSSGFSSQFEKEAC